MRPLVTVAVVVVVLLVAAARLNAAPPPPPLPPPGSQFAFTMGRMWWHNDTTLYRFPVASFDFSGCAFGFTQVGGGQFQLNGVSVAMTVRNSNDTHKNRAHIFGAWLFVYDSASELPLSSLNLPPPLHTAHSFHNFSTEKWNDQELVHVDLFSGLDPALTYSVWLIHLSEPNWNAPRDDVRNFATFAHFTLNETMGTRRNVHMPMQLGQQQSQPQRRIEFIGDSITAGYCILGAGLPDPEAVNGVGLENFVDTYAYRTAARLRAALHTMAWSGIGLAKNYHPGPENFTMYEIYRRTVATQRGTEWPWSFSQGSPHTQDYVPAVVHINLGTNDFSNATYTNTTDLKQRFIARYQTVIRNLTTAYAPTLRRTANMPLHAIVACGPMLFDPLCSCVDYIVAWAAESLPASAVRVRRVRYPNLKHLNDTACGHPDVVGAGVMEKVLIAEIKKAVGWEPEF